MRGAEENWHNLFTTKVMSGLVIVRYISLPTSHLYNSLFGIKSPSSLESFKFGIIGIDDALQANMPADDKSSIAYFL